MSRTLKSAARSVSKALLGIPRQLPAPSYGHLVEVDPLSAKLMNISRQCRTMPLSKSACQLVHPRYEMS